MALTVTIDTKNGVDILRLTGKVDAMATDEFKAALLPLAENPDKKNVVLDFAGVSHLVSAGLRVVLQAVKIMRPRGAVLYVAEMDELVTSIFKTMGFFAFVTPCATVDECLEKISASDK